MRSLAIGLVVFLIIIVTACSAQIPRADQTPVITPTITPTPTATPLPTPSVAPLPKPKVLRINLATRPDSLDPQKAFSSSEIAILQMAYEGLTRVDEKGMVVPGAAERWEFSTDGKTLTFH